ncbi:MAG: hypothetical protein ACLFTT_10670 [Candidatus Hydrogenedentota bacterium]
MPNDEFDYDDDFASDGHGQPRLAFLMDGSAFFFALMTGFKGNRFEYTEFLDMVAEDAAEFVDADVDALPYELAYYFTSTDPNNEGQNKFNQFLESIGLDVITETPWAADVCNRQLVEEEVFRHIRFDASIAYTLGFLGGSESADHAVIVTDSFALRRPVLDAVEKGLGVTLAFFGQYLDPRWTQVINKYENMRFLDLSDHADRLFTGRKSEPVQERHGFPGLRK